ncbi:MAG: phosphate acyltransferase PlsX [Lachnospiraceae bacterium]|nr:phosphate acyltransferase PlsX [Lachnospiraceae bacterium]
MDNRVRIALDAMGGDNAPSEIVKGAVLAAGSRKDVRIFLVGKEELIREELKKHTYPEEQIEIVPASEVIEMAEHPVSAIRKKKDSSMVVGMKMVHEGSADAFVTAGNSGAVLVGGQVIVGRLKGVERPPFATVLPTEKGVSLLLDCGANVDARPSHLVQFARMGSIYMEKVIGVHDPTVGIVNIGAEEEKGNALVKETFPLLRECSDIRFTGSCEARDITAGQCDVIVAEGFAGNIILKMYEGSAKTLLKAVKAGLMSSLRSKIGAVLIKPALKSVLKKFDADQYGGAPMLGLRGLVVKAHGNAKADVIRICIDQCVKFNEQKIGEMILEKFSAEETESRNQS